jgi:hypothetical protein
LPDQLFSLANPAQSAAAARCDKDCTRHAEVRTHPVKATG